MQTTLHITKDIINKLELNPYIEGMQLNIDFLENILSQASNDYYNTDKPLLTDNTFDILENIVRAKKPNSYIFNNIGAKVIKSDDAVKLPYYMGSLDKVKPNEKSLTKWIAKHNTNIVISDKLDGLSALLIISISLYFSFSIISLLFIYQIFGFICFAYSCRRLYFKLWIVVRY